MYQNYQIDKLPKVSLNLHQSVFVSQIPQQNRTSLPCILKCYRSQQKNQQQCLRRLQKSTHNLIVRPIDYRIIQGTVYFATQIQQMSLQTMIFLHRLHKAPIQKEFLKSFIKIFDTLNKVHKGGMFHGNLKPSNIFIKFPKQYLQVNKLGEQSRNSQDPNFEDIQWRLGQANINQTSQNRFYSKSSINPGNTSKSMYMDPYQNDFYSLGVILLQMLSLQSIEKIYQDIINDEIGDGYVRKLQKKGLPMDESRGAEEAREKLMDLIRCLLNPKNMQSMAGISANRSAVGLNTLYHDFQQSINYDRPSPCQIPYYKYILTAQILSSNFIKQNLIEITLRQLAQNISKQQLTCSQILKYINKHIDPEDEFYFSTSIEYYLFIEDLFKYHFENNIDGLLFAQYFLFESHVHYMGILMKATPLVELANSIMQKAIDKFQSPSELFKQQADGKDIWKANDLLRFFNSLRVPFGYSQIQILLRAWTNSSDKENIEITSIKIDQFRKVFKEYVSPKKAQRKVDSNNNRTQQLSKKVQQLFMSLKQTHSNSTLVHFFRILPGEHKWQLPLPKLRQQIRKYYKFRSQLQQKQIFQQILSMSRVTEGKNSIDYIKLLIKLNIYDPIELFRYVLVERINQDGVEVIYKRYEKDGKGWTRMSIGEFCEREYLSFDEKHQNFFFNMLDKDDSQYVDLKQLMFKLTGLKHFDMDHLINTLKDSTYNNGNKIFQEFLKIDSEAMFVLNNVQQLIEVIQQIDRKIKLQPDHYQQVYEKFQTRKGKFQYLIFMRYFVKVQQIFMRCCAILINTMFKGNFEQFFKTGLKGEQRKWKRQSLALINDMALLKFKQKQLDEVWYYLDPHEQNSLTKQQIATKFNIKVQKLQQFKSRTVDSLNDYKPKRQQDKKSKNQSLGNNNQRNTINKSQEQNKILAFQNENQLAKNELVVQMSTARLLPIITKCYQNKVSERDAGWIGTEKFCEVLKQEGMNYSKRFIQNNFPYCVDKRSNNISKLNYLKFFLLISQFRKDPQKSKAQCLLYILSRYCEDQKFTIKRLFDDFRIRDDMMKLIKFESMIKNLLDDQVFFQDINDVWMFLGNPKYLTSKDLERILSFDDIQMLRGKFKSSQQQRNLQKQTFMGGRQKDTRSRQDSGFERRRKQSHETFAPQTFNLGDRDSFGRDEQQRHRVNSQIDKKPLSTQNDRRDTEQSKRRSEKQKSLYDRQRQYEREKSSYQRRQRQETSKFRNQQQRKEKSNKPSRQDSGRFGKRYQDTKQRYQQVSRKTGAVDKRTSMQNNLLDIRKKQPQSRLTRKQLLKKFEQKIQQYSSEQLTRLFMTSNKIEKQDMSECLEKCYDFSHREAVELTEQLADFGIVKIQTVKKYLRPPGRAKRENDQREVTDKRTQGRSKSKGVSFNKKNDKDERIANPAGQNLLINPLKRKLNIPLIRQQIRMFIRSFSQRYSIQQLQRYFFQQSDILYRDQFTKKCRDINSTLTSQNVQRIFDFLKPNEKDEVSVVNFKLTFVGDEGMKIEGDVEYLPKELNRQLQDMFKQHDTDNSGNIQPSQVQALLSTLGYNESQRQIQSMFKKIDKNFDNQISLIQFKQFIEQFILPQIGESQNDIEQLFYLLKMNDVFGNGRVSLNVLMAIVDRYGVKITIQEGLAMAKCLGNQSGDVNICDFLYVLYYPTHPSLSTFAKSALYKIKYRKKISLKDIQKTFTNISSNFIIAYTSKIMKSELLKKSTAFQPILHQSYLFFNDYFYKDIRKIIWNGKNQKLLVEQDPKGQTVVVQIRVPQAVGVPIPQSQTVKSSILKRSMNITFFDMSSQNAKHCIISLQADWDAEIQDQWIFDSKNRSFYMKIANYQAKKYQKILLLFELIITMSDASGSLLEVSCGTASMGVKQIVSVDSKLSKKIKLSSGIPTKPKQIDRQAVTKRSGWKTFLGSSTIQSQLTIDIFHQKNIDIKPTLAMIYALPSICLVRRKSLHYMWTFREYFAQRSVDRDATINADYASHYTVKAFLMSVDIDDVSSLIMNFWRDKIQSSLKTIHQARCVMYHLLTDLYMILCARQFELKLSNPCGTVVVNKNLFSLRQRMVQQMLQNIQNFVKNDLIKGTPYKRIKAYNYNYDYTKKELFGESLLRVIENGLTNIKAI